MTTFQVGYFVGSLSQSSINRTLSQALIRLAPEDLAFTEIRIDNLALYSPDYDADYPLLVRELTAERVRAQLARHVDGEVRRYELPLLPALQFVCTGVRDGGVTTSLALDTHGKSLSSRLLALEMPSGGE